MNNDATLLSIQVGTPQTFGVPGAKDPQHRPWTTSIYKIPMPGRVRLGKTNLAGDAQADLRVHGGPDKAVNVYASEHYARWCEELRLAEMPFGAFGENFTVRGLTEAGVCIGDVYAVGSAVVQVSQPRRPCWKLARRWGVKDLAARVEATGLTGWYFRVLTEGEVEAGNSLRLVERPHPQWPVEAANLLMTGRRRDVDALHRLAECAELSASWRRSLLKMAAMLADSETPA